MNVKEILELAKDVLPEFFKSYGSRLKKAGIREFVKKTEDEAEYTTSEGEKVRVQWKTLTFPDEKLVVGFGIRTESDDGEADAT